ncbi:MAG: metal dependent phosphohydrolase [Thermoleophilia bacterium]|nr:metal dependent phosphohydrolase [Thermoleophilia bacterium]MCZ4496387.1 metal dependent phosphohydrolase [Thermoleophilia bacterium]
MTDHIDPARSSMHPTVAQLVDEVRDLPMSMSETLPAVINACDNADTSVNDLTALISADQSLVAMLLKLANSAYYGYARRIETLPEAIVLLGFSTIKSLAITATTMNLLFQSDDELSEVRHEIWSHSLGVGVAARALARKRGNIHPEKAFVAGLLHDLGMIILSVYRKEAFLKVLAHAQDRNLDYEAAELEVLGFSHAELGAQVAEAWSFPATHCEAIRCHHEPTKATLQPGLAQVAHLADWMVVDLGVGKLVDAEQPEPDATALAEFRIPRKDLPRVVDSLRRLFAESDAFMPEGAPLKEAI